MRKLHEHARGIAGSRKRVCVRCRYDKHVEVAHIRAVSSFPKAATYAEVNAPENLLILCPNCHWEFDRGMFSLAEITED